MSRIRPSRRGCYYPPTLITGLHPASPLMQEEIFGPVLVSTTFRTPAEAVQIANQTRYGLAASVWSENVNLALDVAPKLASGIVWVNGTNMMDAAAPFGGVRESGFGREGGAEGLTAYTKAAEAPAPFERIAPMAEGTAAPGAVDRTFKLYVGGRQARPEGGQSRAVWSADGARCWGRFSLAGAQGCTQCRRGGERLGLVSHERAPEGAGALLPRREPRGAGRGVRRADRGDDGRGRRGGGRGVRLRPLRRRRLGRQVRRGRQGRADEGPRPGAQGADRDDREILCPDGAPLLGLMAPAAHALAMGNCVVACASEPFGLAAADLVQVLETSDVPAGALNVLTGDHADMAPHLAGHMDVGAVWCLRPDLDETVEREAARDLKRTWCGPVDLGAPGTALLEAGTEIKTVWVPYGEG